MTQENFIKNHPVPSEVSKHFYRVLQENGDATNPYVSSNLREHALAILQDLRQLQLLESLGQGWLPPSAQRQFPRTVDAFEELLTRAHTLPAKLMQQQMLALLRTYMTTSL